ncbi:hypothetical protein [Mycobacterium tuberculosis]|uniref:hypothetical protein n=1 Tax=Mycobacterium tuberculosis TaxID=1773 RepID=UPI00272CFD72|nr:hypothetical protein [Mycobacterium tuberculosis]
MPTANIRLAIVDDRLVNRKTIRQSLEQESDIQIVLEAVHGEDFLAQMQGLAEEQYPDLVLMDIDIRLAIVDDRLVNRKTIRQSLEQESDIQIVLEAVAQWQG